MSLISASKSELWLELIWSILLGDAPSRGTVACTPGTEALGEGTVACTLRSASSLAVKSGGGALYRGVGVSTLLPPPMGGDPMGAAL